MKDVGKVKQRFQHTAADRKRLIGCGIAIFIGRVLDKRKKSTDSRWKHRKQKIS